MENQISFNNIIDGTKNIYNQIETILSENKDFKVKLLNYRPSEAKDVKGAASVYVGNVLMCKIYNKNKSKYISVKEKLKNLIANKNLNYKEMQSEPNFIRICFEKEIAIDSIKDIIFEAFILAFKEYTVEPFGCCHRYIECSNSKKCIHPDMEFSIGCKYRENLENDRIFYGINKNI